MFPTSVLNVVPIWAENLVVALLTVLGRGNVAMRTKKRNTLGVKDGRLVKVRIDFVCNQYLTWICCLALFARHKSKVEFISEFITADVVTVRTACPKCGTNSNGRISCCGRGGAWSGKCGDEGEGKEHTWSEGLEACICKDQAIFPFLCVCACHY